MSDDYAVLLHGLGRTRWSMYVLERILSRGFRVINIGYPSRKYPVEQLAECVGRKIRQCCTNEVKKIHFVTHSLGGIILRCYLKQNPLPNLGRVVMLSPPNQGSELVDAFRGNILFEIVAGPVGAQLGTEATSVPNILGPVDFEVGVITGDGSLNPIFSHLIPGADDGRVSVKRSQVEGMADLTIVPQHHSFIMNSSEVVEQVICFLKKGQFRKEKKKTP
ncbi:MAG: alpha/beta hydrolase [Chloroflexi bacterium]|nr:alpha/beta hydrolase [Chloroflexota bacterium]